MLNKELLLGYTKVYPYTHLVKVSVSGSGTDKIIGYSPEYMHDTSTITPKVLSISGYDCGVMSLYSQQKYGLTDLRLATRGAPQTIIYLGRSDIGLSYGRGSNFAWDASEICKVEWEGMVFTDDDVDKVVPIWLSSNPPPY